jgi:hypothetical protein
MKLIFLLSGCILFADAATAGTVDGNAALGVAAIVATYSPSLQRTERTILERLFAGQGVSPDLLPKQIVVGASVTCRASNVDIASHRCDLDFQGRKVELLGREAHELYATLAEIGIAPEGAAGSSFEAAKNLRCTVDPAAVLDKAGGGAHCEF